MSKFFISINGTITNEQKAKISVFDRGFLYGDSVYEATRTFDKRPFRLKSHIDRLFDSAQKIDMSPTFTKEQITNEIEKFLLHVPFQNTSLRIVLTSGTNEDLGLDPELAQSNNLIIYAKEIKPNPPSWLSHGVSMTFYQKSYSPKGSLPKSGNYLENIKAYKQAKANDHYDAFMVNTEGFVTEGTTSNAWIIKDNHILTPPLEVGLLDGLTRKTLLAMSEQNLLPMPLKTAYLSKNDFLNAEECFITSTTRNILPVTQIDSTLINNGHVGAITLKILHNYLEFVKEL